MKMMIQVVTEKSKEEIGQLLHITKKESPKDLNTKYEAILKDLSEADTTEDDLEQETASAITRMTETTVSYTNIRNDMENTMNQNDNLQK